MRSMFMAWRAWPGKGLPGEPVREMLIEAVEKRFGSVEAIPAGHQLEFLTDNGGAYIAIDTRRIARELGLKRGFSSVLQRVVEVQLAVPQRLKELQFIS